MRRILKEIALAAWLPTTAGAITFATNWLVWFVVGLDCVPLPDAPCPKLPWGRYITYEVLGDCYLYSFLAMSVTGGSDAMLFIRELRNREKDKKIADERLEQEKARYDEQQKINAQQRAEDRERNDRVIALSENMMQQVIDERRADREERRERDARLDARLDADREERRADRQALTDALARFTDALERNANRNGNGSRNAG